MKFLPRYSRVSPALFSLLFLSIALLLVLAPVARSTCNVCQLIPINEYPWFIWTCPSVGPGYTGCYHDYATYCQTYGSPCQGSDPGCFLAGTMVSTPDGDRAIESLKEGDAIWCVSDDGKMVKGEVLATLKHLSEGYYRLNGSTLVTGDHRFLAAGPGPNVIAGIGGKTYESHTLGQWIPLGDLSVGQQLIKFDGSLETVETIDSVERGVRVYNLEVGPFHNYFANKILVHNKKPDPQG